MVFVPLVPAHFFVCSHCPISELRTIASSRDLMSVQRGGFVRKSLAQPFVERSVWKFLRR